MAAATSALSLYFACLEKSSGSPDAAVVALVGELSAAVTRSRALESSPSASGSLLRLLASGIRHIIFLLAFVASVSSRHPTPTLLNLPK